MKTDTRQDQERERENEREREDEGLLWFMIVHLLPINGHLYPPLGISAIPIVRTHLGTNWVTQY